MAVADGPAADEVDRFVVAESPVAGRRVEFVVVAVQHFEADRVQRPHLAARGVVVAMHGFQATAVGQAREFRPHVRLDSRQQQHARRQILRHRRQRDSQPAPMIRTMRLTATPYSSYKSPWESEASIQYIHYGSGPMFAALAHAWPAFGRNPASSSPNLRDITQLFAASHRTNC